MTDLNTSDLQPVVPTDDMRRIAEMSEPISRLLAERFNPHLEVVITSTKVTVKQSISAASLEGVDSGVALYEMMQRRTE
jgi:hypothetical protein